MPHIIIEYNDVVKNITGLTADLHAAAMSLDALPTGGFTWA